LRSGVGMTCPKNMGERNVHKPPPPRESSDRRLETRPSRYLGANGELLRRTRFCSNRAATRGAHRHSKRIVTDPPVSIVSRAYHVPWTTG
jgi:hypothetical protein